MLKVLFSELKDRPELQKALKAFHFLGSERAIRIVIGFFIHTALARYLGPDGFGELTFIRQIVLFFTVVSFLGIDDIYVKKLVEDKENIKSIASEVFWLRLQLVSILFIILSLFAFFTAKDSSQLYGFLIAGASLFALPFLSFEYVFQSRLQSKELFISRLNGYVLGSLLRVLGIFYQLKVNYFILSYTLEDFVSSVYTTFRYLKEFGLKRMAKLSQATKQLVYDCFPMLVVMAMGFGAKAITMYFLRTYSSPHELGIYSVCATLIELWYFVPIAISTALLPKLVESRLKDQKLFQNRVQYLYDICLWLGLGLAVSVYLLGEIIISVLYGVKYQGADRTLFIMSVVAMLTAFGGSAQLKYLIIEGQQKSLAVFYSLFLLLHTLLLFYFQSNLNAELVTQLSFAAFISVNLFMCFLNPKFRNSVKMYFISILFPIKVLKRVRKTNS